MSNSEIVTLVKDGDDVVLPISDAMAARLGWKEGDELHFSVDSGVIKVTNVTQLMLDSHLWEDGTLGCSEEHVEVVPPEVEARIKAAISGVSLD